MSDEPETVAKIDGDTAARVEKKRDVVLWVWREDDQLYRWSDYYTYGPKETNTGIINTLNDPYVDVEYVSIEEVPCLPQDGDQE
jgi:hypothetical protein